MPKNNEILYGKVTQLTTSEPNDLESYKRLFKELTRSKKNPCKDCGQKEELHRQISSADGEIADLKRSYKALEYIVSRWNTQIGPPDPVWHLMHEVHLNSMTVDQVIEECLKLVAEKNKK